VPPGYHPEAAGETMVDRTCRVAEGLLFLPYLTGECTPHLDPLARGAFFGLTGRHGAVLLAGVAAGLYRDVDEACSTVRLRDEVTDPERTRTYEERYDVYRSLYPATKEAMHRLADLAAGSTEAAG
jgi:sugar (pentulose or hexulose) kinase